MKTKISIMLGGLVALSLISCQKDEMHDQDSGLDESYITCEVSDMNTKTHLDEDFYVVWDTGDEILVKGDNGTAIYQLVTGAGTTRGTFKKVSGADLTGSSFVAYSPASAYDGTDVIWPEAQKYMSEGVVSGAPMKAEASSLNETFLFKNIGGLLRLTLKVEEGTKKISFIKIKTEDKDVVLNCPEGGVEIGASGTPFYFELPAKDSYSKFVIEATATDSGAYQKIATKGIKIERSKITSLTATTKKKWQYLVSVSPTDKVIFAPGNLYCYIDWSVPMVGYAFENNQTDYRQRVGYAGESAVIDGVKTTTPANTSGLFQWVGNGTTTNTTALLTHGAFSELNTFDQAFIGTDSDFVNFGDNYGDGKTWRTLSKEEWEYMVNVRKVDGATGYGNTCVWCTFGYTQGLLIFPDGYTGPKSGFSDIPENAIFLPDAGYASLKFASAESSDVIISRTIPNGNRGCYWTSTAGDYTITGVTAYGAHMGETDISMPLEVNVYYRERGYSMRLVSDTWTAR